MDLQIRHLFFHEAVILAILFSFHPLQGVTSLFNLPNGFPELCNVPSGVVAVDL
jgi:hypothetical protein